MLDSIWFKTEFSSLSLECSSATVAIQIFCFLYQESKATSNVNELRYKIFPKKNVSGDRLPPTLSSRVNYQTFIWKSACVPVFNLPSPNGNVLQMEGLKFSEELISNSPLPDALVEMTRHKCKKVCKTNSSSWKRANLMCTDSCSCNISDSYKNTNHDKLYESDEEENEWDQLTK